MSLMNLDKTTMFEKAIIWKVLKSILKKIDNYSGGKKRRKTTKRKVKKLKKKKNQAGKTKKTRTSIISRHAISLKHPTRDNTGSTNFIKTKKYK